VDLADQYPRRCRLRGIPRGSWTKRGLLVADDRNFLAGRFASDIVTVVVVTPGWAHLTEGVRSNASSSAWQKKPGGAVLDGRGGLVTGLAMGVGGREKGNLWGNRLLEPGPLRK